MSLLYGQLDEMDSSLDSLQAEVSDMAENDELWTAEDDMVLLLLLLLLKNISKAPIEQLVTKCWSLLDLVFYVIACP